MAGEQTLRPNEARPQEARGQQAHGGLDSAAVNAKRGGRPSSLYQPSLALLTDLYQLSMGCAYHRAGMADREACFSLFFRKAPFGSGYTIACGLADALDWIESLRFDAEDLAYLAELPGNDGKPLFDDSYLRRLESLQLRLTVHAIPEGTVVFPHEPLLRLEGPLHDVQLVETALLCMVNFQTLIATKAARVCLAARGEPVLEFGLRRAQGIDGALAASRAAYVGGCAATSNVLAGKLYGIPVRGTHAHSWVMAFPDEPSAFRAYADALPNNCTFLVDTYDTLEGVRHAVAVGLELRARGHELAGIRLDSGDLAWLSVEARKILDAGGFPAARIVASNDLDEGLVESLKQQGARIDVWGVGTKLVTGGDQAALGGVYKLSAIRDDDGTWQPKVKLSEQVIKVSNPGMLRVRRYRNDDGALADCIYDELHPPAGAVTLVDPNDPLRMRRIPAGQQHEELLQTVMVRGERLVADPALSAVRARTSEQLAQFHAGVKRLTNPHAYPVGLEASVHQRKVQLVTAARLGADDQQNVKNAGEVSP